MSEPPPPPTFFVTAHSRGLTRGQSVSVDSKGLICTKIVQNPMLLGSAHSKGLSRGDKRRTIKKRQVDCRLNVNLHKRDYNRTDSGCQEKTKRAAKLQSSPLSRLTFHTS